MEPIYLDHNATTPLDPEVLDAMMPYLTAEFGNPSSGHPYGRRARAAIEEARARVASLLDADPEEIVFTSGGTEASQLALLGGVRPSAIVSFALEHPATLRPIEELRARGAHVTLVPPDRSGVVRLDMMLRALEAAEGPCIASLMHAHNETGALQPVAEIGRIARARGVLFHVDAAQSAGKIPVRAGEIGCDLLTVAAHKLYGPKGVGALYVRRGTALRALLPGAGQERGLRGGTENVAGIVGFGAACVLAGRRLEDGEGRRLTALRERLWEGLRAAIPGIARTAEGVETLPNTLHVRFPGVTGNALLAKTPGIAASTGSACHAGSDAPPAAIVALGVPETEALGSVRLSVGHSTTEPAIDAATDFLIQGWRSARGGNPDGPRR